MADQHDVYRNPEDKPKEKELLLGGDINDLGTEIIDNQSVITEIETSLSGSLLETRALKTEVGTFKVYTDSKLSLLESQSNGISAQIRKITSTLDQVQRQLLVNSSNTVMVQSLNQQIIAMRADLAVLAQQVQAISNNSNDIAQLHTRLGIVSQECSELQLKVSNHVVEFENFICPDHCHVQAEFMDVQQVLLNHIAEQDGLNEKADYNFLLNQSQSLGMSGDMELFEFFGDEDVLATELNAAAAGTFIKHDVFKLQSANRVLHTWAEFAPVATPGVTATDGDIGAPTLENGAGFTKGIYHVDIVFDTDAGSTKTYQAGDEATIQLQVSATDAILGWTVASLTKTYTVV